MSLLRDTPPETRHVNKLAGKIQEQFSGYKPYLIVLFVVAITYFLVSYLNLGSH